MTATVDDGRRLYAIRNGVPADPATDLRAQPGTVAWGRLLRRASNGDEDARAVVRRAADRGDDVAREVLDGAGAAGAQITSAPGMHDVSDLIGGDAA